LKAFSESLMSAPVAPIEVDTTSRFVRDGNRRKIKDTTSFCSVLPFALALDGFKISLRFFFFFFGK